MPFHLTATANSPLLAVAHPATPPPPTPPQPPPPFPPSAMQNSLATQSSHAHLASSPQATSNSSNSSGGTNTLSHYHHAHFSAAASHPQPQSTTPHQVPFAATPIQHAPSALGFGFGMATTLQHGHSATATLPWGQQHRNPAQTQPGGAPRATTSFTSTAFSTPPRRSEAKRRRDDDGDDDDDRDGDEDVGDVDDNLGHRQRTPAARVDANAQLEETDSEMAAAAATVSDDRGSPSRGARNHLISLQPARPARQYLPKRIRAGLSVGPVGTPEEHTSASRHGLRGRDATLSTFASPTRPADAAAAAQRLNEEDGVDLGTLLATLDRSALLSLLTKLIQTSPDATLPLQILAHLPSPSLESVHMALDEAERAVRMALPANLDDVRPEYVWGRLKNPLLEFVVTVARFLPFYVVPSSVANAPDSSGGGSASGNLAAKGSVGVWAQRRKQAPPHPTTTFGFLHEATTRTLRIQALLPPVPSSLLAFALAGPLSSSTNMARRSSASLPHSEASQAFSSMLPLALTNAASSPNALTSMLVPQLLDAWTELFTQVCRAVNEEGRIVGGQETMRGWVACLETMGIKGAADAVPGRPTPTAAAAPALTSDDRDAQHHDQGSGQVGCGGGVGGGDDDVHRGGSTSSALEKPQRVMGQEEEAIRRIADQMRETVVAQLGWLLG